MIQHSIVVPAYNEEHSIAELHRRVVVVMDGLGDPWELVFVNDGSTDGTAAAMDAVAATDPRVVVVHQPRNFGKSAAYDVAFATVRGAFVFTLDADLQDEPAEIPNLLARMHQGADLVVGWKQGRMQNEPLKRIPSGVFNALMTRSFGLTLHDTNSGIRGLRRTVADSLTLYGDLYRFIPQLAFMAGFRVAEIPVKHHARQHGVSKYGPKRFWTGLLDLLTVRFLTRWRDKPLHFFATLGAVPVVMGLMLEAWVVFAKLALGEPFASHVAAMIIGVTALLVGVQLAAIGLVGELLRGQTAARSRHPS